jgi:uncharacterized membrane protein YgdD (TMEM256/DUF423 family)
MLKFWFVVGCVLAGLGVAAGAFGAHALKQRLPTDLLVVFETGVRYQMYHAFGLMALSLAADRWPNGNFQLAGWLLLTGIFLFSGSLYALCLSGIRSLGAVTPIGGLCFLVAWFLLALGAWNSSR